MRAASPTGPGTPLPEVPRLRDGLHHGEPHEDGADGVVLSVVRQATDAVVTVAQDLNPQLVVFLKGPGRGCGPESLLGRGAWERKQRKDRWEESVGVWEGPAQAARVPPPESRVRVRVLTAASLSKRAKSSLSSLTSSCALQAEDSCVKPTMSANRMLRGGGEGGRMLTLRPHACHHRQLLLPTHGTRHHGRSRRFFKPQSSEPPAAPGL